MKVNELRIGNLVEFEGMNLPIDSIHSDNTIRLLKYGTSVGCYFIQRVNPIPLTEDWFLKFGFEKINHINGWSFWSLRKGKKSRTPSISIYDNRTTVGNNTLVNHCEYIHQLQNLCFASTGEELKYD